MGNIKHNRSEEERKVKVTSLRLSEAQHQRVKELADARGMSVSGYITATAVNGMGALTPEILANMQNLTNDVCTTVREYAPDKVNSIQKEMNELWQRSMLSGIHKAD